MYCVGRHIHGSHNVQLQTAHNRGVARTLAIFQSRLHGKAGILSA